VLCQGAFDGVAGWPGLPGRDGGPDADAAVAAGDELGEDAGPGFGEGGVRAGPGGRQGAADGVQGGGEGDPVRVQAGGGGGQADDGADGLVDGEVGP